MGEKKLKNTKYKKSLKIDFFEKIEYLAQEEVFFYIRSRSKLPDPNYIF
jgi:hypothetical protein